MANGKHVFISYSRRDGQNYAEKLEANLKNQGFNVWRDTRHIDPANDFTADIERGIENASHVVVCVSPDTKRANSFVRREIQYSLLNDKPVIPLRFADIIPHAPIVTFEWIDLFRDWDSQFDRLCTILKTHATAYQTQERQPDPQRPYLEALYKRVVKFLDQAVIRQIDLMAAATQEAVDDQESRPPEVNDMFAQLFAGIGIQDEWESSAIESRTDAPQTFMNFREVFEAYKGQVLLLGEPGAGKTVTLMGFAREIITARLEDHNLPLPIWGTVATWDAEKQIPLAEWLASGSYAGFTEATVLDHIARGKALLLFDGLDELGSERLQFPIPADSTGSKHELPNQRYDPRKRFMDALANLLGSENSIGYASSNQIIVTCRVRDYDEIGQKIRLKGAAVLQPLNDQQMENYLQGYGNLWAILERDKELKSLARTPLLLSLFAYGFSQLSEDAKKLRTLSGGDLRDHIFITYIQRRYRHEAAKHHLPLTLDELMSSLGWVAMDNIIGGYRINTWGTTVTSVDNVLFQSQLRATLGDTWETLVDVGLHLNLLALNTQDDAKESSWRFIHLLLRDALGFQQALNNLQADDSGLRGYSARVLGAMQDERAVLPLIDALNDSSSFVRMRSAIALGNLHDGRAIKPLIALLHDPDADVRYKTIEILAFYMKEKSVAALIDTLKHDADIFARRESAWALGVIGSQQVIAPLIDALQDSDASVRLYAVTALGSLRVVQAVPALIKSLVDKGKVRWGSSIASAAAQALEDIGTPEAKNAVKVWRRPLQ